MNKNLALERITNVQNDLEKVLLQSIFNQEEFDYIDEILDTLTLVKDIKQHIEEQIKE